MSWDRKVRRMRDAVSRVPYDSEDDLDPENLQRIDSTMQHRDMQHPKQQAMLMEERKRLEAVQQQTAGQQVEQQFGQRLYQRMNPYIGTARDTDPEFQRQMQAEAMAKIMAQMQRRVGRPQPGMDFQRMQLGAQE